MRWFEGGIAEAVATSKSRNAVFVVFSEGKDEASKKAAATMDDESVSKELESDEFVAIKLDSESEAYRQFVQIYHLVPIPSLFFIGGNGVPLEVVAGEVDVPELLRRINSVLQKSGKVTAQEKKTEPTITQEQNQEPSKSNPEETESLPEVAPVPDEAKNEVKKEEDDLQSQIPSGVAGEELTTEEKVERAKELVEKKRKMKEEEEEQDKRLKELERRKMGQEVQKLRRWQQDQELKQLKEERQKEKAEEVAARERILKQIAQDRAERASKFSAEQEAAKEAARKQTEEEQRRRAEHQAREAAARSDVARIQFRLPDGSAHSHNFEATATLSQLRMYAATQLNFPFRNFTMSTTFPRREFTANDDSQTVRDLQLIPTAVILILPTAGGTGGVSSSEGYSVAISRMVWSLMTPFFTVLNYLRNFIFGGGAPATGGSNPGRNTSPGRSTAPHDTAKTQNSTGARKRTPGTEATVRREGNVHRLSNRHDSSDDENNTWNGNSTQQM